MTEIEEAIEDIGDFAIGINQEVSNLSLGMAIEALEEIQQYRAIGTVEECMEAVAKQAAKKVCGIHKSEAPDDIETYGEETLFGYCPVCGELQNTLWNSSNCGDCGQKLDWSDGE